MTYESQDALIEDILENDAVEEMTEEDLLAALDILAE